MIITGFYIVKDSFFELVNDPYLKSNKDENRPFYYCVREYFDGQEIYWLIPLSSRVGKYQKIIESKIKNGKSHDGIYLGKIPTGRESAFLIQDVFPVTAEFIEREYTIGGQPMILPYENSISEIDKRARKIIRLVKNGIKLTPTSPNITRILSILKNRKPNG